MSSEGLGMSLQSINVSRELVLDGVEVSLGGFNKLSAVFLNLGSQIADSLLASRRAVKFSYQMSWALRMKSYSQMKSFIALSQSWFN